MQIKGFLALLFCGVLTFGLFPSSGSAQPFDYSPGFTAGAPEEMKKLSFLEGKWRIILSTPLADETAEVFQQLWDSTNQHKPSYEWIFWDSASSRVENLYNGAILREDFSGFPISGKVEGADGIRRWKFQLTFSYDRYRKVYRVALIDNVIGLTDLYEGKFYGKKLVLSNLKTGTYTNLGLYDTRQQRMIVFDDILENSFSVYWYTVDEKAFKGLEPGQGFEWKPWAKLLYQRSSFVGN